MWGLPTVWGTRVWREPLPRRQILKGKAPNCDRCPIGARRGCLDVRARDGLRQGDTAMLVKWYVASLCIVCVLALSAAGSSTDDFTVNMTAHVNQFAEWVAPKALTIAKFGGAGDANFSGDIGAISSTVTSSVGMSLACNSSQVITVVVTDGKAGKLTLAGRSLKTEYMLHSAKLQGGGDAAYVDSADFLTSTYTIDYAGDASGVYALTLDVRASSPGAAVPVGDYSCAVILRVSF